MQVFRERPNCCQIAGVWFFPGTNFVPADKVDAVRNHPFFVAQCKCGNMRIIDNSVGASQSTDEPVTAIVKEIETMSSTKAVKAIAELGSIPALKRIVAEDKRRSVRCAAMARLAIMTAETETSKK